MTASRMVLQYLPKCSLLDTFWLTVTEESDQFPASTGLGNVWPKDFLRRGSRRRRNPILLGVAAAGFTTFGLASLFEARYRDVDANAKK